MSIDVQVRLRTLYDDKNYWNSKIKNISDQLDDVELGVEKKSELKAERDYYGTMRDKASTEYDKIQDKIDKNLMLEKQQKHEIRQQEHEIRVLQLKKDPSKIKA